MRLRTILVFGALCVAACAQQPIGEVQGTEATVRGAVTVSPGGTTVMSGSQVGAGNTPANIKLARGGELKVCPKSSITLTASASGREALIGVNAGAIETRYRLASSADTILTPDFRLSLPGPGDFHFAIAMRPSGDMCVKSLPGNSSSMIVNEVFGDGAFQVKPGDAVLFIHGIVQNASALPANGTADSECGCPGLKVELGFPEKESQQAAVAIAAGEKPQPSAPLPGVSTVTTKQDEVITKVDAPIIFRGEEVKARAAADSPATSASPQSLPTQPRTAPAAEVKPEPKPVEPPKSAKKKWYQRLGSAIANIFR